MYFGPVLVSDMQLPPLKTVRIEKKNMLLDKKFYFQLFQKKLWAPKDFFFSNLNFFFNSKWTKILENVTTFFKFCPSKNV